MPRGALHPGEGRKFLFAGQGSQYPGMGKGLFETQPVFREAMERCDEEGNLRVIYEGGDGGDD